jgi:L-rhamnose isomerase
VGARVDVQLDDVAFFAVRRTRLETAAVGHDHFDEVIVRVNVLLHGAFALNNACDRPVISHRPQVEFCRK